jgi:hypothetical protein
MAFVNTYTIYVIIFSPATLFTCYGQVDITCFYCITAQLDAEDVWFYYESSIVVGIKVSHNFIQHFHVCQRLLFHI